MAEKYRNGQLMIEENVYFYSEGLKLEGVLTYREDAPSSPAILLCNPHPNLGGDINNNIITNIAHVSAEMGFISLRFNYRGVGNSESHEKDIAANFQYWEKTLSTEDYMDAVTDAQAAFHYLSSQMSTLESVFLVGYSFGCIVGMRVCTEIENVVAFASVSTPFGKYNLDFLANCNKPKLFIYSKNDFATTEEETLKGYKKIPPPKTIELIPASDHFYRKQEATVSQKVCSFFKNIKR